MEDSDLNLIGAKLLIVDDLPENLDILSRVLEAASYDVYVALDGENAIRIAGRLIPDLILLDVMMPELDGFETCQRLKENPATRDIPVIFLTARTETEDIVEGFETGAVDYVIKPFNTTELLARVKTHLTIHRLQLELEQRVEDIARMKREHEAFLGHELNNRLAPVLAYSQMISEFEPEGLGERQRKRITAIYESAEGMASLIDEIRKLQNIEAGDFELEKMPVDLGTLVEQVVADLDAVYGEQVEIHLENRLDDATAEVDANLLTGVFQNLIKNGIEHVAELEEEAERRVRIDLNGSGKMVVVSVQNAGPPVPTEKLATFFEKFNTGRKSKGGTGLGTTYAYLVTQAHGGTISVGSNEVDGTTLTVRLPRR